MKVPQTIISAVISHAKEGFPYEVCGLMGGRDGVVSRIFRMTNSERSPISYFMEPSEQFKAFKEMRKDGIELLAIYHSHPSSPAYPSRTDVGLAFYPEALYVIVSLQKTDVPEVKGYRIIEGKITEETLEVIP